MSFSIIVDSASDIELDEAQQMGVTLLPMEITFGDEIYRDGYDLTNFSKSSSNAAIFPKPVRFPNTSSTRQ